MTQTYEASSSIDIDAPAEVVWKTLTDTAETLGVRPPAVTSPAADTMV